jgi:ABC-type transporter Mla MlaB component
MLRITSRTQPGERPCLIMEGRLTRRELVQLRSECQRHLVRGQGLVLDLSGVLYVDEPGALALEQLQRSGAELVGGSAFVRELLGEASS